MSDETNDERPPELVAASTSTTRLGEGNSVVQLVVPDSSRSMLRTAARGDSGRLLLRVEDLDVDDVPETSYNVFLQQPDSDTVDVDNYLGTVTFFGVEMGDVPGHDEALGYRKVFDVTDVVAKNADQALAGNNVSVVFVPILTESTAAGDDERVRAEHASRLARANVRIGRVALYVG